MSTRFCLELTSLVTVTSLCRYGAQQQTSLVMVRETSVENVCLYKCVKVNATNVAWNNIYHYLYRTLLQKSFSSHKLKPLSNLVQNDAFQSFHHGNMERKSINSKLLKGMNFLRYNASMCILSN